MLKKLVIGVLGLVALVAGAFLVLARRAEAVLAERPAVRAVALLAPDSLSIERGDHLAHVLGCRECHGADLGGLALGDAPPMHVGAPNLTRGRGGLALPPDRLERAVRQGVGADGQRLYVMPALPGLADADVVALAAFLGQAPPVDRPHDSVAFTVLGKALVGAGRIVPELQRTAPATPPAAAPTEPLAVGRYYLGLGCVHCHGAALRGAPHPDPSAPPGPSLEPASRWDLDAFATAVRTGRRPGGPPLDGRYMPWKAFAHLTDAEVAGLHAAVKETVGTR